ncbi:hypothetical protein [Catenuloplanes indicus]|uniref:Uncharacterized protein n=1 Tax=Catenuloplanes indicus TaxID=137267 RepID=A0AAE3W7S7_9ACTN|nr:hypothetical protein [Catenuloplanes indicus]MDQ0371593.1 hypothetical protein [Catenuloplanes indicus]
MTTDMLVGITCDPRDYGTRLARWPGARHTRIFGYPGKGIPSWKPTPTDRRIAEARRLCPGIIPHVSFKDWPDDMAAEAMVRAWLNQLPPITAPLTPGGPPLVMLSHMHEPGPKDFDPAEYRRRQFLIAIWLAAHPRGGQVDLVHIDANIWVEGKGGRDLSIYLPGVGLPSVDTYARSWKPYPTVDDLLWAPLRLADATRTPPMLPEFGIARRPDDPTGEQRAELMHEALVVLWAEGCRLVSWWEDLGTAPRAGGPAPDFRLDDEPSRRVWEDAMAGRI